MESEHPHPGRVVPVVCLRTVGVFRALWITTSMWHRCRSSSIDVASMSLLGAGCGPGVGDGGLCGADADSEARRGPGL